MANKLCNCIGGGGGGGGVGGGEGGGGGGGGGRYCWGRKRGRGGVGVSFASPSIKHLLDTCPFDDTAIISGRVGSSATVSVRVIVHTNLNARGQ